MHVIPVADRHLAQGVEPLHLAVVVEAVELGGLPGGAVGERHAAALDDAFIDEALLAFAKFGCTNDDAKTDDGLRGVRGSTGEARATALKLTSKHLLQLGVVDDVIPEPLGGAHRDHHQMSNRLKMYLVTALRELTSRPVDQLLDDRYGKFRKMGVFFEGAPPEELDPAAL